MKRRILTIVMAIVMTLLFMPVFEVSTESYAAGNPYNYNAKDASGNWANCTWWAWQLAYDNTGVALPAWGNAGTWYNSAVNAGYQCDQNASANSIAVRGGGYGHVQFVTDVSGGNIYVKEGGYRGTSNGYHEGWTSASGVIGYIHLVPAVNHNPVGAFDVVQDKCGAIFVRGWAFDPDDKTKQIDVHVYIGADSTAGGGEGHPIKANTHRDDVHQIYGCGNHHGYDAVIETQKTGTQTVYVFAINIGEGGNQLIGSKTVNISNPLPVGTIDSIVGGEGCIKVGGWAFDPSDTSKPVAVHVYVGSSAGSSNAENHIIVADAKRTDVNKSFGCGDYHGFSATIPTDKTGSQPIYIYAINIGTGWVNTYLGTRTVTITKHSHILIKTPAKSATTTSEGNIEYWTCTSCGKYFADAEGKTEIAKDSWIIPATGGGSSGSGGSSGGGGGSSGGSAAADQTEPTEEDKAAASSVAGQISALPAEPGLDDLDQIRSAIDAYNALTDEQKALLDPEMNNRIAVVEARYKELTAPADKVIVLINAIPADVTTADKAQVAEARAAYDALAGQLKALVSPSDVYRLEKAEFQISSSEAAVKKPTVKKAKAVKGKKASVSWKKVSGADGYRIAYSTSKKFSKKTTNSVSAKAGESKKTLKKLKAGKKYYVRVRAFTKVYDPDKKAEVKVYGKWSKAKSFKAKK